MEQNGMTAEREGAILERAIATFGCAAQVDKAIEEMAELTKALLKYRIMGSREFVRSNTESDELLMHTASVNICEEMADVQIMLNQLRLIYGDDAEWEEAKLRRLEERLDKIERGART